MGTFEKLGILVIVMIVVMILAVAIYQWGGADSPALATSDAAVGAAVVHDSPLTVDYVKDLTIRSKGGAASEAEIGSKTDKPAEGAWTGGIPRAYVVQKNDVLWKLVVDRWGLDYSFVDAMKRANPGVNFKRLMPGDKLVVPDPAPARKGDEAPAAQKTRIYTIQTGDVLSKIAEDQLGSSRRWKEIRALNPGLDPHNLPAGKEIRIPAR